MSWTSRDRCPVCDAYSWIRVRPGTGEEAWRCAECGEEPEEEKSPEELELARRALLFRGATRSLRAGRAALMHRLFVELRALEAEAWTAELQRLVQEARRGTGIAS